MRIRTNTAGCNLGPPDDEDVIEEGLKAAVVVHPAPEVVGGVHRGGRVHAFSGHYLGKGGHARS